MMNDITNIGRLVKEPKNLINKSIIKLVDSYLSSTVMETMTTNIQGWRTMRLDTRHSTAIPTRVVIARCAYVRRTVEAALL